MHWSNTRYSLLYSKHAFTPGITVYFGPDGIYVRKPGEDRGGGNHSSSASAVVAAAAAADNAANDMCQKNGRGQGRGQITLLLLLSSQLDLSSSPFLMIFFADVTFFF